MLAIFTHLTDWLTHELMGLEPATKLGNSVHFFIEDTSKIFFLLVVMIYIIGILRAGLNLERVRAYIQSKDVSLGTYQAQYLVP